MQPARPSEVHGEERAAVLVAGGAGFIGSHLCEALLAAGRRVVCVDSLLTGSESNLAGFSRHPNFTFRSRDICQPVEVEMPLAEVYNLACPASPPNYQADPEHTMLTNVLGTANLLRLAEVHGARFLQASTSEVYGDPERHPQREDYTGSVNCTGPRACYDEGKRAAEALCFDFLRAGRADVRVARIFNTYGPRMQPDDGRIVSNLVVQALSARPLTIYGSGNQTRSFCFVSDLVRGLLALMALPGAPDGPVNLGNPGEFTINELAGMVRGLVGSGLDVRHEALPVDDPKRRCPDIGRARALLDWEPEVDLADGLARTVAHFRERLRAGVASAVPA
ncbi:MAG: SDR family oxidoreductase [Gluconacetobacter diazotrophicus]|nr:SDR family oxidoreductase [Gluconacetobacter diazotrophicus]